MRKTILHSVDEVTSQRRFVFREHSKISSKILSTSASSSRFNSVEEQVSRRWLAKINGAKKRLKLMLHDWKRCSSLQFLKQSKDIVHNEGIINSISYFTPNLINCWQTVEPWHCPFKSLLWVKIYIWWRKCFIILLKPQYWSWHKPETLLLRQ
jgi:hypothetical protein